MTTKDKSGQAFPRSGAQTVAGWSRPTDGMTLRQYAAIKLRVSDSGLDWLDEMIRQAKRDDIAAQALAIAWDAQDKGYYEGDNQDLARCAYQIADAMLKERDK